MYFLREFVTVLFLLKPSCLFFLCIELSDHNSAEERTTNSTLMNNATTADATSGNQRTSSRSSMLIAEWIMKKVMNDNAASTATEAPATATTDTPPSYRDNILQQLLDRASDVRRTFEQSPSASKRKHTVLSATAAAALHMASINRKRKFESRLPSSFDSADTKKSNTFQRPISRYPTCVSTSEQTHAAKDEVFNSFVSKQILPKDLTYNDVVFFGPDYDTSHVGNQRFKVWIDIHKSCFAQASTHYDKTLVATSLVNTVMSSVPSGRFFSVSVHDSGATDLRYNKLGYDKSVEIVMESLSTTVGELFNSMIIKKETSEAVVLGEKKSCDMPPLKQTAGSWDSKEERRLATTTVNDPVFRRHSSTVSLDCSSREIVMESQSTTVGELFNSMIIKKESSEAVVLGEKKSCDMPPLKQTAGSWDSKEARRLATTTV